MRRDRFYFFTFMFVFLAVLMFCSVAHCQDTNIVYSPANLASISGSNVHVLALPFTSQKVIYMQVYLDSVKMFTSNAPYVDANIVVSTSGTHNLTVQYKRADGIIVKTSEKITITASTLAITTQTIPGGTVGQAYSFQMTATGGSGGYTWSATGLPSGLSINASGLIYGTPTVGGTTNATITVKDTSGQTASVNAGGSRA